jgi:ribosomal protein S18 acetylase RimI-like enzyme
MDDIKMVAKDGEPNLEDFKALSEGMLAYHALKGHPRKSEKYSIFLKNEQDKVLGGVVVTFLWNGMEIDSLWVDESIRGKGWGRKLMEAVEKEGVKRGSTIAYTNTFPWQAPGFYEKLGYSLYGKLEDFPKGSALSYYSKKLE